MNTALTDAPPLRAHLAGAAADACLFDRATRVRLADLVGGTTLGGRLADLAGRSVLIATATQFAGALALIELDGVARRVTILPPDVDPDHLGALIAGAEIDAAVVDGAARQFCDLPLRVTCTPNVAPLAEMPRTATR